MRTFRSAEEPRSALPVPRAPPRSREGLFSAVFACSAVPAFWSDAQTNATRLAVLQAEDRRAPTARDLAIIQSGARSGDGQTVRVAVRALGRLERPSVIADITPALRHPLPEVRTEAANAIGQAAQGWKGDNAASGVRDRCRRRPARRAAEGRGGLGRPRGASATRIGRLPYSRRRRRSRRRSGRCSRWRRASMSVTDRLGVAKGFEALVRLHRKVRPPGGDAVALLRRLATPGRGESSTGARVRRLALEALISAAAVDDAVLSAAAQDPDAQVRRLAMRATAPAAGAASTVTPDAAEAVLAAGARDGSPAVRLEALRSRRTPRRRGRLRDRADRRRGSGHARRAARARPARRLRRGAGCGRGARALGDRSLGGGIRARLASGGARARRTGGRRAAPRRRRAAAVHRLADLAAAHVRGPRRGRARRIARRSTRSRKTTTTT